MEGALNAEAFAMALALIGIVILVSALLSGLIERSGLPQVAVFLALGAALGPFGLGALDIGLDSSALRVVATLSLALVLFTDAVTLNVAEIKRHSALALRVLGPGTLLSAAVMGLAGWWLLGLSPAAAAILGAALASTDPVLLRGVLRRRDLPASARQALHLESGLNDVVLLPVVLVAMVFLMPATANGAHNWGKMALDLFVLGPGAGVIVGLLGVSALDLVRRRIGVRRDYESLYSLGVAFTAFAAAEAVHGSGFLAAFAAGLTIAALDVELCDCFVEYGGVTAEMLLLFTFVLFGSSLIWSGLAQLDGATILFTVIVLFVRTPIYLASLIGSGVDRRSRLLISWFGPRGLSSLLLVLLPVFAGVPGSDRLFAICSLVVLASVVIHGGSPLLLARAARRREANREAETSGASGASSNDGGGAAEAAKPAPAATREGADVAPPLATSDAACPLSEHVLPVGAAMAGMAEKESLVDGNGDGAFAPESKESITFDELRKLREGGQPVVVLDARTERTYDLDEVTARGALRLPPDNAAKRAAELNLPRNAWLIIYCA